MAATTMEQVAAGIEAGRRVGWAKFYDAQETIAGLRDVVEAMCFKTFLFTLLREASSEEEWALIDKAVKAFMEEREYVSRSYPSLLGLADELVEWAQDAFAANREARRVP